MSTKRFTFKYVCRLLVELLVLLAIYLLGCQVAVWLAWPIPGGVIGLEELADTPFLMYQRSFVLNDRLLQACQQLGFTPRESGRSGQADFLVALVAAGQGVVLLPSVVARGLERPGVVRLTLRAPQFLRWDIAFIWRQGAYLSKAALAWLALLREYPISRAVR